MKDYTEYIPDEKILQVLEVFPSVKVYQQASTLYLLTDCESLRDDLYQRLMLSGCLKPFRRANINDDTEEMVNLVFFVEMEYYIQVGTIDIKKYPHVVIVPDSFNETDQKKDILKELGYG